MAARPPSDSQFDLFVPYVADLPLRDQRETMERPFFSLAKRKRLKPIEYTSPNGEVFVNVFPNQEFGMATIWDADILIWAASVLNDRRKRGENDLPRTLSFHPYDLLKTIGRETGGRQYQLLREALGRLQSTTIVTNIRVKRGKKQRQFSWIEGWTDLVDDDGKQSRGMTPDSLRLVLRRAPDGWRPARHRPGVFLDHRRPRTLALPRRPQARGRGRGGGLRHPAADSVREIRRRRHLPALQVRDAGHRPAQRHPWLPTSAWRPGAASRCCGWFAPSSWMATRSRDRPPGSRARRCTASSSASPAPLPLFGQRALSEATIERIRHDFPGWDIYALQAEFDAWLADAPGRSPEGL